MNMAENKVKRTVWVKTTRNTNRFRIEKTQNTIAVQVGAWLTDTEVQMLIDDGVTVNISTFN